MRRRGFLAGLIGAPLAIAGLAPTRAARRRIGIKSGNESSTGARARVVTELGQITSINLISCGDGYTTVPTVTITS